MLFLSELFLYKLLRYEAENRHTVKGKGEHFVYLGNLRVKNFLSYSMCIPTF